MPDQPYSDHSTAPTPRKKPWLIRLAVMLLAVWVAAAYFLLPLAWRLATRHHPAVEGMPGSRLRVMAFPVIPGIRTVECRWLF